MNAQKTMTVRKLTIEKQASYEDNAGRYIAKIEYESPQGEVKMPLSPDISEKLLELVGPLIAQLGAHAAQEIADNVFRTIEDRKSPLIEDTQP